VLALLGLGLVACRMHAWMPASGGSMIPVVVTHAVFFAPMSVPLGSGPALFAEMFPASDRLSGYSVAFNIGLGVFGGLTPMVAISLISLTGHATGPAVYMTVAAALAVAALAPTLDCSRAPLR
jgi:MHS family proline/betaine transporter-like MFS transporter